MVFSLFPNVIDVWQVSVENEFLLQCCKKALTEDECRKASSFKFKKVQDNYILSQGTLRLLLSKYLQIKPEKIKIGRHGKGKPYSIDNPDFRFNMSNSGGKVVYSFSQDEELGIDIEKMRKLSDFDDLIDKNFTSEEKAYINKVNEERQKRFFKFWTIKEAYLKAIGEGMRLPPDNLEFSVERGKYKLQSIYGVQEMEDWIFTDVVCGEDYQGTLTYKNNKAIISERIVV